MKKIVLISGSFRKNSYNTALLKYIENKYKEKANIKILDISKLPYFNEDLENSLSPVVISFKKEVESADGIIISTPEYNYSIPGVLKNAIDWLSRGDKKILDRKHAAIMSASLSIIGGARAQVELKKILQSLNMNILYKPDVYVTDSYSKIDDSGKITDSFTRNIIEKLFETFLDKL